jgi:hypothetical protein
MLSSLLPSVLRRPVCIFSLRAMESLFGGLAEKAPLCEVLLSELLALLYQLSG